MSGLERDGRLPSPHQRTGEQHQVVTSHNLRPIITGQLNKRNSREKKQVAPVGSPVI